jgi:type II secretory pathway pseudopilin PulG
MSPAGSPCARCAQRGWSYIGLLLAVALGGATLAAAGSVWRVQAQREREAELLFVGDQFRQAITRYREQTPAGQQPGFPGRIEDLLDDRRWPVTRRHLRRVYVDPMTGGTEWNLVEAPAGAGFMGIYSRSTAQPLKRAGFPTAYAGFAKARDYTGWRFVYAAEAAASAATAASAPPPSRGTSAPGR